MGRGVIRYTSRTVSYAKELTSVSICYSQGTGFNISLSRLLRSIVLYCTRKSVLLYPLCSVPVRG